MPVNQSLEQRFCPASREDIPVIFSLAKELVDTYENLAAIDYDKVIDWMQHKISQNISAYTCVYVGIEKAGYYCLTAESDQTELDDLYILPQFRGQGIGTAVIKRCIEQVSTPLYLYVFKGNTDAIKLYSRMGFSVAEDVSQTRIIMRREVDRQQR